MKRFPFLVIMLSIVSHVYWNFLAKWVDNKEVFMGLARITETTLFIKGLFVLLNLKRTLIRMTENPRRL
jgi:hypothetical protein